MRGRRFGPDVEAAAYFVACEALTNVVKHAGATGAVVTLVAEDGRLHLQVRDDGAGLNGSGAKGHGLTNLRDRVEALGGHLLVEGAPDRGTSLSAALPIGPDDA
jgi:signal transduction histidine kinase